MQQLRTDHSSKTQRSQHRATARTVAPALAAAIVLMLAASSRADGLKTVSVSIDRLYPAVWVVSYVFEQPRPIRAWAAHIDLAAPEVELVMTCPGDVEGELETACATTSDFAEVQDVQLAINASPFSPFRQRTGERMDIVGLGACDGKVYSSPHDDFGALVTTKDGGIDIWSPPIGDNQLARIDDALGGFRVLVRGGQDVSESVIASVRPKFAGPQPRTAVGLTADRQVLWLFVVDGRNSGHSEGMTLAELAQFGITLKCDALLNLDGGGSTTLVVQDARTEMRRVVNQPVGRKILGTERRVGNHLGVRIRPIVPAAPRKP